MKYQIKSKNVKEYIELVDKKIKEIENFITDKENYMNNNLVWDSDAGKKSKSLYQQELNKQKAYCNSLKMFMKLYEKGIEGFGMSLEELKKKFRELQEENNQILKGEIEDDKY